MGWGILMSIAFNKDAIKESLSLEQIEQFLADHGGEPIRRIGCLVSRTICHNPATEDASHKLYYYENTKLFKCYTECADTNGFDIFDLTRKIMKIQSGIEWTLYDAQVYIINYFSLDVESDFSNQSDKISDFSIFDKYERNLQLHDKQQKSELQIFDDKILQHLPYRKITPWLKEGITEEVMQSRGIKFDPYNYGIVIPHYNINNELVGIRERTLIKENEDRGKYIPAILNGKMYNHPLGFNLYNINKSAQNIKSTKKVIIGEGEKFCLGYASYFGADNDMTVACCGSNLTHFQFQLLQSLGVEEIVIAFDKQYQEPGDKEWKQWTKKLSAIHQKYGKYIMISFMFDTENKYLGYKESPIDAGRDIFLSLYNERITL